VATAQNHGTPGDGWTVLDVVGIRRSGSERAAASLFALGAVGVQESWMEGTAPPPRQPWDDGPAPEEPERHVLTAWFEETVPVDRAQAVRTLSPWLDAHTELVWRREAPRDWEAESRASFRPIEAGGFVIAPPWDAPEGSVRIEPGAGFGTGDHPTTRQALTLLEPLLTDTTTVLDIGCGSGVLALAAASRGARVHGIDIDPAAVANAEHNAQLNGFDATFSTDPPEDCAPAEIVLANLHAELLVHYASTLERLATRHLVLAGILSDRLDAVTKAFRWSVRQVLRAPGGDGPDDLEWIALHLVPVSKADR
jgi:ribosomal protein L11 methyltransferase